MSSLALYETSEASGLLVSLNVAEEVESKCPPVRKKLVVVVAMLRHSSERSRYIQYC